MAETTIRPESEDAVVDAIRAARGCGQAIEIVGGGSKREVGRPLAVDRVIDTGGLAGITVYEPEELVLTAGAGTPLAEIEAAVAGAGQRLAFEPSDWAAVLGGGGRTIGGVVAANLSGPRRILAGAARDHVLGLTAVTGRGEVIHAGGRVVKNVTGYDMCKLFAGSWGTLGVMTSVTVKTLPAPEVEVTTTVAGLPETAALSLMRRAVAAPIEVSAAAHLPAWAAAGPDGGAVTALRIEGFPASVDARLRALSEIAATSGGDIATLKGDDSRGFWRGVASLTPFAGLGDVAVWRLSVPPAAGAAVADAVGGQADARCWMDWGGGLVWCAVPGPAQETADAIRRIAGDAGGHAMLLRAPAATRAAIGAFHPMGAAKAALTARLKDAFDPDRVLNPGRMFEGI